MNKKKFEISFIELDNESELPQLDQELLQEAKKAYKSAYAPYSNFKVGSAVQMGSGSIVIGSNQENIAFPSGLCAERVAIFSASATLPKEKIDTIAVFSEQINMSDTPITPCGSCRQVLAEYEKKQSSPIRIILYSEGGKIWIFKSVSTILPLAFKY